MKLYQWDAVSYAKYSKGQELWAKELIEKLSIKGYEDILDLGCGDGKITQVLAKNSSGKVVGIDSSEEMIKYARKTYPSLDFQLTDAVKLTFKNQFDIVFSNAVFHWVSNHESALKGVYKALRANGKILLQMGGYGNAKEILDVMDKFLQNPKYHDYFKSFQFPYTFPDVDDYEKLLGKVGFSEYDVGLISKDMVHEDLESFKGWIYTTWFPYMDCLPEELREEFVDEFVKAYLKKLPLDSDGKVHVHMVRLEVMANKWQ